MLFMFHGMVLDVARYLIHDHRSHNDWSVTPSISWRIRQPTVREGGYFAPYTKMLYRR